jgi:two-component system cell cycle sensor histidine kinase/response regulator CckA
MPDLSPSAPPLATGLSIDHFIEHSPIAILRLDSNGTIVETNQCFHRMMRDSIPTGQPVKLEQFIAPEDHERFGESFLRMLAGETVPPLSLTLCPAVGESVIAHTYMSLMHPQNGMPPVPVLHMIDQTEQKNLELRFSHSQKMQAVGQLAGGVAHDFNNLLTAMIGFCDLLLMRHPAGDPSFADIMQVKQNANRAANLVRQLLAFSRRQTLQPKTVDLTDVLAELSNLIRRLIGENIQMKMMHGRELGSVRADQGQLEQVIINLAVNARDAMKEGGTLTIRTSNVVVDAQNPLPADLIAPTEDEVVADGDYVLVEVEDTGSGIRPEIVKNVFEPFFSTKEVGSGTGLGLATCYGIIKQTGGYIFVRTQVGTGTNFHLYFKRVEAEAASAVAADVPDERANNDLTGRATVLLVEDETPVRIFAARALRNKGYEVLEADSGENAIEVFTGFEGKIDVIISDVMMPGINGPKMISNLYADYAARMEEVRVIFISGYAEDAFADTYGAEERSFNFLPKPFTLKQLASKVKEVLDKAEG